MMVPNNLYEMVWRHEIEAEETSVRDAVMQINNIYARLKHQSAPAELLEHVFDIRYSLTQLLDKVRDIRECFPEDPRQPK